MRLSTSPRVVFATVIVAAAALALTACSESSSASTGDSASSSSGSATTAVAQQNLAKYLDGATPSTPATIAKMPDLKGKTVWWVPLSNNIPIIQQTGQGLAAALKKVGATMHVCDGNLVPTTIGSCLTSAANQGAAAVVTGFIDYSMIPSAFDALQAKKIPTVIAGEPPSDNKTDDSTLAFFPFTDLSNKRMTLAADWAINDSKGKGNILVIRLTDSQATLGNAAAVMQEIKTNCSGCTTEEMDTSTATLSRLQSAVSSELVSNPNIGYVLAPLDTDAPVITAALSTVGKAGKVKIVASGVQFSALQLVVSGSLSADVGDSVEYTGWEVADGLFRLMAGEQVGSLDDGTLKVFTADNVKGLKVTAKEAGTSDWYGGEAWKKGFQTAWGVN